MAICKKTSVQVIVDVVLYFSVCIPLVLMMVKMEPSQRGFYCDDDSIRYPYNSDTVTVPVLLGTIFLLPLVSFLAVEFPHQRVADGKQGWVRIAGKRVAKLMGLYLFGLLITMVLTEAGKLTVGRLRPHFIDVCRPDFSKVNCSLGYVEDAMCTNTDISNQRRLREARKSFPSGHASLAFYIATFLAYYYQQRVRVWFSVLLRLTLQTVLFVGAMFCALSRVMDHKHHPGDVAVGTLLGILVAFWVNLSISKTLGYRQYRVGLYQKLSSIDDDALFNRLHVQYHDDPEDNNRRDTSLDV